ncbi:MAG: DNA alkylation repair protein [Pseudomonas sp.]|uniref:DNA alkylation repair protein n=1 Tax=Pseudomonas sp. TaxID=306 RepID=UPI003391A612
MSEPALLKDIFNPARFRQVAEQLRVIHPGFDAAAFVAQGLEGLEGLSLMQRLRRMSLCLRAGLPDDFAEALVILRQLAPRIEHGFVTLVLPDYVALYGLEHFDESMAALKFFTVFGSAEFAIREFLRREPERTLAVMHAWALDETPAVRRLASEGCRPRLPWSFRLTALVEDPGPVAGILERLRHDSDRSVRTSVANHLNDIAKDHPDWVLNRLEAWPLDDSACAWIARHALRTLIKQGDRRALTLIGAGATAQVALHSFSLQPGELLLGEHLQLNVVLQSTASTAQRLVLDYRLHYVKKSGGTSGKVFKLKEVTLAAGDTLAIQHRQHLRNLTTRVHYAGRHRVELLVNGDSLAQGFFQLAL